VSLLEKIRDWYYIAKDWLTLAWEWVATRGGITK